MSAEIDELEKLLGDVRKIISDNRQFLQNLAEDSVAAGIAPDDTGEDKEEEEFEEL